MVGLYYGLQNWMGCCIHGSSFTHSFGNYLLTILLYPWDTTGLEETREVLACVSYEEWVNRQGVFCGLGGQRQLGRNMRTLTPGRNLASLSQEGAGSHQNKSELEHCKYPSAVTDTKNATKEPLGGIVQVKTKESGVHLESPRRPSNSGILPTVLCRRWMANLKLRSTWI